MTDLLVARMMKVEEEDLVSGTFTWRINNFSKLKKHKHYSDVFVIGGYKWRMFIYPKGYNVDYLSVFLDVPETKTLPYGWNRYTKFTITLVDQFYTNNSVSEETEHMFMANTADWGFASLVPLSDLHCHDNGYLVNDACIVEVEVLVPNGIKILEDQETGELMDFRGFGKIEKTFVPFLEEVCSCYPSLIEDQMKRSRTFVQCAFTSLGRVLHFLKTTKAKDMNVDACQRLQLLWEELEAFKFNLAWLKPHVQSVFAMEKRVGIVNRLKEDVDALKNEIERRRAILAEAEADLEVAMEDLVEAEEEYFSKMVMDSELGYPLA